VVLDEAPGLEQRSGELLTNLLLSYASRSLGLDFPPLEQMMLVDIKYVYMSQIAAYILRKGVTAVSR
jgi:hypothetical protein